MLNRISIYICSRITITNKNHTIMKKIKTMLAMAMTALCAMTFSACDEDDEIAYTLEGTWEGNMYVSMMYDGMVYDATYTELCFSRDPYRYSSGSGYWIDYYNYGPWGRNYVANHMQWNVSGGVINVYLVEEGTYVQIHDYRLSDNYFVGNIYYGDQRVSFKMRHTSSPNWNDFYWGWDYYYSKKDNLGSRANGDAGDSGQDKPVRMFGRTVGAQ